MPRQRIDVETEQILLQRRGDALAPVVVEGALDEAHAVQAHVKPQRHVIVAEGEARETGRVHQDSEILLPAPFAVPGDGIRKAQAEHAVSRYAPVRQRSQRLANLGVKPLTG
jgi:hypothetical protein